MLLGHSIIVPDGVAPLHFMLFLHGILGSGANWRGFARRLVTGAPEWGAILVDLRMHGASQSFPPPHTVEAAACDLAELEDALALPVRGVLGHSFGGKVAMEYASGRTEQLTHAFFLDSNPGPRPTARGSETTTAVLAMLETLPREFRDRAEFVDGVVTRGFDRGLADWLGQNLERRGDILRSRLDLAAIRALLDDYFMRDLWRLVESPTGRAHVAVVVGGKSSVFDAEDLVRLERAVSVESAGGQGRVSAHVLPTAGHWLHVDDPEGLLRIVTNCLCGDRR